MRILHTWHKGATDSLERVSTGECVNGTTKHCTQFFAVLTTSSINQYDISTHFLIVGCASVVSEVSLCKQGTRSKCTGVMLSPATCGEISIGRMVYWVLA